jgi:hypothetical protein
MQTSKWYGKKVVNNINAYLFRVWARTAESQSKQTLKLKGVQAE